MEIVEQQSRMRKSPEGIEKLIAALALAQGEMEPAAHNKSNTHFKNTYSDISALKAATKGPLSKNGLAVIQCASTNGLKVIVTSLLGHSSGQWIENDLEVTAKDNQPQSVGSATTYAKRYAYSALVGIESEKEEDDGETNRVVEQPQPQPQTQTRHNNPPAPAPKPQAASHVYNAADPRHFEWVLEQLGLTTVAPQLTYLDLLAADLKGKIIPGDYMPFLKEIHHNAKNRGLARDYQRQEEEVRAEHGADFNAEKRG